MFGELEDSDIYVNNQDENFEEQPELDFQAESEQIPDPQEHPPLMQPKPAGGDNKKLFIYVLVLILLLVCAGGFYFYKMKSDEQANMIVPPEEQNAQEMGDYFYGQAKGDESQVAPEQSAAPSNGETTAVIDVDLSAPAPAQAGPKKADAQDASASKADDKKISAIDAAREKDKKDLIAKAKADANKKILVPVATGGRVNPFMPYQQENIVANMPQFDIIAPPMDIPEEDPLNDELMSTKISGIMYDSSRPSAIINFDGTDHLVHKGDRVKGYSVIDITPNRVVLKYGSNIYRASVGQQLNESLNFNEVSNINSQFGGAYSRSKNIIEIKAQ